MSFGVSLQMQVKIWKWEWAIFGWKNFVKGNVKISILGNNGLNYTMNMFFTRRRRSVARYVYVTTTTDLKSPPVTGLLHAPLCLSTFPTVTHTPYYTTSIILQTMKTLPSSKRLAPPRATSLSLHSSISSEW